MKIYKVLNNNAFISFDENNEEIVVMGKGISFGKKAGEEISLKEGYKIFSNIDQKLNKRLIDIASFVPDKYLDITEEVVKTLENKYNKKVNEIIYITLTEHIHGAVERFNQGIQVKNPLLMDIKRLFKDEYEVSKYALKLIKEEFTIEFDEDEAGYIAQHIVNSELDNNNEDISTIAQIMQEILDIIKYTYKMDFDEESTHYYRFVTHLKFFAQRVSSRNTYEDDNEEIFELLKDKYTESYRCVTKIKKLIEINHDYKLSKDEQLYLMIHIQRITTKANI